MKKNIFTKTAAMALAGTVVLSLAACGNTNGAQAGADASAQQTISQEESSAQEAADISAGGWETNSGLLSLESNAAAKAAFEKATEGLTGYEYEPIALLGTQLVAGTNYSILVRGSVVPDAEPAYEIIIVYEDLEGNARITGSRTLTGEDDAETVGGFTVNGGDYDLSKNADVQAAFDRALEGLDGADYEAVAYLGSQVVAGTNYLAFMRITPVVPDAQPEFALVTVYEDLEGKAEMTDIETVSPDADADSAGEDASAAEGEQIPNPFESFASLEEAAAAAGFELSVRCAGQKPALYRNLRFPPRHSRVFCKGCKIAVSKESGADQGSKTVSTHCK